MATMHLHDTRRGLWFCGFQVPESPTEERAIAVHQHHSVRGVAVVIITASRRNCICARV